MKETRRFENVTRVVRKITGTQVTNPACLPGFLCFMSKVVKQKDTPGFRLGNTDTTD